MIAHQDDVLEAGLYKLLGDSLVDSREQRRGEADGSRQISACLVWRKWQHRRRNRVAELFGDRLRGGARHQRVAAIHVLRSALFGSTVVNEHGGLTVLVDGLFDLGPGHHLEFDERACGLGLGEAAENTSAPMANVRRR